MGVEWWISDSIKNRYGSECQRLNIRTAELRSEVNRLLATIARCPENIELLLDLIRRCQTVDQLHVKWSKDVPDYFRYEAVAWEDPIPNGDLATAEVFPGRVDAYQDLWVVSVWNLMRASRIILASLIVRCAAWICSPVDYRTTPEYATAARTCVDVITDIIASVPYQLGYFSKRKELLERCNLSSFGCGQEDAPKGLPGYFLTWPLTSVAGQDYATDAQRAWVKGRLAFIGNTLGVRYAHILNQVRFVGLIPLCPFLLRVVAAYCQLLFKLTCQLSLIYVYPPCLSVEMVSWRIHIPWLTTLRNCYLQGRRNQAQDMP